MSGRLRRVLAPLALTAGPRARRSAVLLVLLAALVAGLLGYVAAGGRAVTEGIDAGASRAVADAGRVADVLLTAPTGADDPEALEPVLPPDELLRLGRDLPGALPQPLRGVVHDATATITAPEASASTTDGSALLLRLTAVDDRLLAAAPLVTGAAPEQDGGTVEVVLDRGAARRAGLAVGDVLRVPALDDPSASLTVRVAGLVRSTPALRRAVPGVATARRLLASGRPDGWGVVPVTTAAGALRASAVLGSAFTGGVVLRLDAARFDAAAVPRVADAIDGLGLAASGLVGGAADVAVTSGFRSALQPFAPAAAAAVAQAAVVRATVVGTGLLALLLVAALLAQTRSAVLRLERARGADPAALATRSLAESSVAAGAGVAIGLLAGGPLAGGAAPPIGALVVIAAVAVLAPPLAERRVLRDGDPGARGRAAVRDLAVVAAAVLAVVALRDRGTAPSADPLLLVAPSLVAAAAAVLLLRAADVVGVLVRRRRLPGRSAIGPLLRAVPRAPGSALPALAIALATAAAVGGALLTAGVAAGQQRLAAAEVAADARIDGAVPAGLAARVAARPGVDAATAVRELGTASLDDGAGGSALVRVLAVDGGYARYLAAEGVPGAARARLLGGAGERLPVVLGTRTATAAADRAVLALDGATVPVRVVGRLDPPGGSGLVVVVDTGRIAGATGRSLPATALLATGPGAAPAVAALAPAGTRVRTVDGVAAALRTRPLSATVTGAVVAATALAAVLAAAALGAALLAGARDRRRTLALLVVLGVPVTAAPVLLLSVALPIVVVGLAAGAAGGLAVATSLAGPLGLDAPAGSAAAAPAAALPLAVLAAAAAAALVLAAAAAVDAIAGRRSAQVATLRIGDAP